MKPKSRIKSKTAFYRRRPRRSALPLILIVCEGEQTEPIYFKYIKSKRNLDSITVIHAKKEGSALGVVEKAIQAIERRHRDTTKEPFEEKYCVFDVEIPIDATIPDAIALARQNDIQVIMTNPCFEYWYILHFKVICPMFDNNGQVVSELEKEFPEYNKSSENICKKIFPDTMDAISNAKALEQSNSWGRDLTQHNSSTHVHNLVEHLFKIS
ncbi:MAG: RloB family protein [Candidatus Zixiibacteriota bacterium]